MNAIYVMRRDTALSCEAEIEENWENRPIYCRANPEHGR